MPDDCGSTRLSAICAATAASIALPPATRMSQATRDATGLAVTAISVRVVAASLLAKPVATSGPSMAVLWPLPVTATPEQRGFAALARRDAGAFDVGVASNP